MATQPVQILLVEDDEAHAELTRTALAQGRVVKRIHHVSTAQQAEDFLFRNGEYADAPKPQLILLSLDMERQHGRELLARIKADAQTKCIPVVVFTGSGETEAVEVCYGLLATSFITKPHDVREFLRVVQRIEQFWLNQATLPRSA